MTDTIQAAANEATQWFETATRDNGERFTRTKDGAPTWIGEMVYAAHDGLLPDDWRYKCISDAVDWVAETGETDDPGEFADDAVDVYTSDRLAWLASSLSRPEYVDEALSEFGQPDDPDIIAAIGLGQYREASEVFEAVRQALEIRADDLASEDVPA